MYTSMYFNNSDHSVTEKQKIINTFILIEQILLEKNVSQPSECQ